MIIHAVSDLVSGPKFVQHLWQINPLELFTFVAAVIITFFTSVDYGIYVSVGLSIFFMLIRIARPRYAVLGRIPVRPYKPTNEKNNDEKSQPESQQEYVYVSQNHPRLRDLVEPPPPGVLIFRFDESLTYPNAGFISDKILHYVQDNYVSGQPPAIRKGDRAWNDPRPIVKKEDLEAAQPAQEESEQNKLYAIVLDFSGVNFLDSTGVQALLDLRLAINRYVGREIEWHFASLGSQFIRNTLIISGFGRQNGRESHPLELLPVVPQHKDGLRERSSIVTDHEDELEIDIAEKRSSYYSIRPASQSKDGSGSSSSDDSASTRTSPTSSMDGSNNQDKTLHYPLLERGVPIDRYPFFHWDLEDAVRAATFASYKASMSKE